MPEDLVHREVAEPSDNVLVHERRLEPSASTRERLIELAFGDAVGIGTELPDDFFDRGSIGGKPKPPEFSLVPVDEMSMFGDEHHAVVAVEFRFRLPDERPRHPKVEYDRRA